MFKNYFKTAWRNLVKDKAHSFINIAGLALGMSVAILIGLWMHNELAFDKNFKNYDRIAQVYQNLDNNGERVTWTSVPYPLAEELRTNYSDDFKYIVMAVDWGDHILAIGDKKLKQKGGFFEKEMPDMFTLDMLQGTRSAFNDPSSVLISASAATAYFGNDNPLGKVITIDQMPPVKVGGVYKDFSQNSTLANLNFVSSWDFWYKANNRLSDMEDPWRPNFTQLFVQLNENASINAVDRQIRDAKLKKLNPDLQKKKPALFLQPMSQWHLYAEFKNGVNVGGDIRYVWMFGIIGVFVLLLACINFMNLHTAKSEKRAKEVGIRKTVGSIRRQLILQFFSESLLTVVFAFGISVVIVWLTLPFFNDIAGEKILVPFSNIYFWLISIVFILLTALLAGSYPALYLSSFQPLQVLKGTFKAGRYAAIPRKVLVVLQFLVSVTLIISTVIVYRQIQFAKNRPVGYSRANLVTVPTSNANIHKHFDVVKNELMQAGVVTSIAESQSPTTSISNSTSGFSWPGKDPSLSIDFGVVNASFDYGKTVGWDLIDGRNFSRDFPTDSSAVILNEAAVHYMGLKHAVGTRGTWWVTPYTVIGVIKNMVIESPYSEVRPIIYGIADEPGNMVLLRLNGSVSTKDALDKIKTIFEKYNPDQPFEYSFVDDAYAKKFDAEVKVGELANVFALLAIFISCLGLFGLTSFIAEQRKKEIGIRKVLGASVFSVWNLLSKDFVLLVLISLLIAMPIAYYFMHNWLQSYEYRTNLSWWVFAAAAIGTLLITIITVSFQAIKAAMANPVKSLRTE
jgi:putative ABC transport system permease protein